MQPLYFGDSQQPLFGVYHEPADRPRPCGVVVCPPLWHEQLRAHRAMRNLAAALCQHGYPVLRFDYAGTGDSGGDGADGSVTDWRRNIDAAIDELRATSGVSRVVLVGVRFGATLAMLAAQSGDHDLERIVLWDPILSGADYLNAMDQMHKGWLPLLPHGGDVRPDDAREMFGFPCSEAAVEEIAAIDLSKLSRFSVRSVDVLDSARQWEGEQLRRVLQASSIPHTYARVTDCANWDRPADVTSLLLTPVMVRTISEVLGAAS